MVHSCAQLFTTEGTAAAVYENVRHGGQTLTVVNKPAQRVNRWRLARAGVGRPWSGSTSLGETCAVVDEVLDLRWMARSADRTIGVGSSADRSHGECRASAGSPLLLWNGPQREGRHDPRTVLGRSIDRFLRGTPTAPRVPQVSKTQYAFVSCRTAYGDPGAWGVRRPQGRLL